MNRTPFLFALCRSLFASFAHAQSDWPKHEVKVLIGFSAGGTADIITRLLSAELSKVWGQPIIIDNR